MQPREGTGQPKVTQGNSGRGSASQVSPPWEPSLGTASRDFPVLQAGCSVDGLHTASTFGAQEAPCLISDNTTTRVSWTHICLTCLGEDNHRNFPMRVKAFPHLQTFPVGAEVTTLTHAVRSDVVSSHGSEPQAGLLGTHPRLPTAPSRQRRKGQFFKT